MWYSNGGIFLILVHIFKRFITITPPMAPPHFWRGKKGPPRVAFPKEHRGGGSRVSSGTLFPKFRQFYFFSAKDKFHHQ
jgi:hypothetical protein